MIHYAELRPRREKTPIDWMRRIRTPLTQHRQPGWRGVRVILVLLAGLFTLTSLLLAAASRQGSLIQVLFGDAPETGDLDANADGALTAADLVSLTNPGTPTPSPSPSPTPTQVGVLFAGSVAVFVPHAVGHQLVSRGTDPTGKVTTETTTVVSIDGQGGFVLDDQTVNGQQVVKHETQSY